MNDHHRFRVFDVKDHQYAPIKNIWLNEEDEIVCVVVQHSGKAMYQGEFTLELCTGLRDPAGNLFYHNDIGEFDNGDRFQIQIYSWLEFYIDWIGEPECEDLVRDFYRISQAKKIGNTNQNPELLE